MNASNPNKRKREPAVYTLGELATYFKVSKQHLLNAIEAGELAAVNIGIGKAKFYRVPIVEVERFEKSRSTMKGERK